MIEYSNTLHYAVRVLDAQYKHIKTRSTPAERERQKAFYDGMRQMFDIMISNAYSLPLSVDRRENDFDGTTLHVIVKEA